MNFSLSSIFIVIGIAAVYCLGLTYADSWLGSTVVLLTAWGIALFAVCGLAKPTHSARVAAWGAVVVGGGYYAVIFLGILLFYPLWERLPTSKVISLLYEQIHGAEATTGSLDVESYFLPGTPDESTGEVQMPQGPSYVVLDAFNGSMNVNREFIAFSRVGHAMFAALLAVGGAGLGRLLSAMNRAPTEQGIAD